MPFFHRFFVIRNQIYTAFYCFLDASKDKEVITKRAALRPVLNRSESVIILKSQDIAITQPKARAWPFIIVHLKFHLNLSIALSNNRIIR
jgi:hypothetical protein